MIEFILNWFRSFFYVKSIECCVIGLQNSGKTSIVNVLTAGSFSEEMIPTIGFNLRKLSKGTVTIRLFDVAGQARFRSVWKRYCNGVDAIIFVVDSADRTTFQNARIELVSLLESDQLAGIPILILGNKNDLSNCASVEEIIEALRLSSIKDREISIYSVSAKNKRNIDLTLAWLIKRS